MEKEIPAHALAQGLELGEKLKCCWSVWGYTPEGLYGTERTWGGCPGGQPEGIGREDGRRWQGAMLLPVDSEGGCPFAGGSTGQLRCEAQKPFPGAVHRRTSVGAVYLLALAPLPASHAAEVTP